jgi:hypothetical protein
MPSTNPKQESDREALIAALTEMPIVRVACKKAGVSPATYYRWREDPLFARRADVALGEGFEFISDMSETQLITLAKEKHFPSIKYWLTHHRTQYGYRPRRTRLDTSEPIISDVQRLLIAEALQAIAPTYGKTKRKA